MSSEEKHLRALPPAPGTCPQCATAHDPDEPHNQESLYWQYHFYSHHGGTWPTWEDAMSHCTPEVQALWRQALQDRGIEVGKPYEERP